MNATGDPITDLLNRLRNAMNAGHERADIPASRVKENL
jgi:ribosomal protein S8